MNRERAGRITKNGARTASRAHPVALAERLELDSTLDGPIRVLSKALRKALPPGPLRNVLHGVQFGHPVHAPLTDLPIGAYCSTALLDLFPGTQRASRILLTMGLASTVPTVLTGLADWSSLHREQQRVGLAHALGMAATNLLYGASLLARMRGEHATGRVLGFMGLTSMMAGSYLGGHLAFRQAAGANHAPSITHLVPLGWHDLCRLEDLPDGWPVHRSLGYIDLFVLRLGDEVRVLADACAHLAGPLHQGRVVRVRDEICVVCPWHGSTFRVDDGSVVDGPATSRQPAFDTRISETGTVQVRPI
ncbi:Rieske (2Fe-2S) protein [Actinocorallia sp. B10E7]|uniref:Rieske (2Fe-2S) protein n=1 Tax=Actinocorallia sp. B10E7 TaxID=3153558 RepID=UPI00325CED7F